MYRTLSCSLTATLLLCAANAHAFCGFYVGKADANLFNKASQVILVRDSGRTVISMLNDYHGSLDQFALVVPVPQVLKEGRSTSAAASCSSTSTPTAHHAWPNTTMTTLAAC